MSEDCHIIEHCINPRMDCVKVFYLQKMEFKREDSIFNDCCNCIKC